MSRVTSITPRKFFNPVPCLFGEKLGNRWLNPPTVGKKQGKWDFVIHRYGEQYEAVVYFNLVQVDDSELFTNTERAATWLENWIKANIVTFALKLPVQLLFDQQEKNVKRRKKSTPDV